MVLLILMMYATLFGYLLGRAGAPIVAVAVAVFVFLGERIWDYQRRKEIKRGILSALREEFVHNFRALMLEDLPPSQERSEPKLYDDRLLDPFSARFKLPDVALKSAITSGAYGVALPEELLKKLVLLNANIGLVNQQAEELLLHRLSSPSMAGAACRTLRSRSLQQGQTKLFKDVRLSRLSFPNGLLDWWQELAHRHWAIVNEGYHKRLFPAFRQVEEVLNQALKEASIDPLGLEWPQWLLDGLETVRRERATPDA